MTIELKALAPTDAMKALAARGKVLSPSFSWQDVYGDEHATMFTVARSAGFDVLQDIHNGLLKALSEGTTFRDFAKELTPLLQAKGWWGKQLVTDPATGDKAAVQLGSTRRLETIFNANMRVSYAGGHWASFERNKKARPYLRYVAIMDERTRPEHAARHNLCLPVDDPYWDTWAPPCGWNCRCTLQSLSQRDVDQMRDVLKFTPPVDVMKTWTNKRTGEVLKIPQGIDPGWEHNAGKVNAQAAVNDSLAQKAAGAPIDLVKPLVEERINSEAFKSFVANPQGSMPVMALPQSLADAIGAKSNVGLVTAEVMKAQRSLQPDLTLDDYQRLPTLGAAPTVAMKATGLAHLLLRTSDGRWLYGMMEIGAARPTPMLSSLRYISDSEAQSLISSHAADVIIDRRSGG